MECVYIFDGKEYSYEQLIEKLLSQKLDNSDILYSVQSTKQERIVKSVEEFIRTNKSKTLNSINPQNDFSFGGDPTGKETNYSKHILNFLDDPLFEETAGALRLPRMDEEAFVKNRAEILKQEDSNLTDLEAFDLAKNELQFFKAQRYDAFILHYLLRHISGEPTLATIKDNLKTLKNEFSKDSVMVDRINQLESNDSLLNNILKSQSKILIGPVEGKGGSRIFRNIPISKVLHTDRGDVEIFDQIDALVIDANGAVYVYKYKITEEDALNWGNRNRVQTPKTEKYRFELAFLQALLEDYLPGINRNNISLNLITLQAKYDHNATDTLPLSEIYPNPRIIEMDKYNGQYQLGRHIQIARNIIQPAIRIPDCTEAIHKANAHLNRLWVGQNIRVDATQQSVEDWIAKNKNKAIRKLYPDPNATEKYYYEILYNGETIPIKDPTEIENNPEIFLKVSELLQKSAEYGIIINNSLQNAIAQAFETNNGLGLNLDLLQGFNTSTKQTIKSILSPYFTWTVDQQGNRVYDWEYQKNSEIADYNILLFKNRKTGQLDVVTLTNLDLNSVIHFKKGSNLAGCYKSDMDTTQLKSTYGNIQAMKTLIFLNYILPNISGNFELGNLKVVTTFGQGSAKHYSIQNLVSKSYHSLMKIVEENTPNEEKFENNFQGVSYVNAYDVFLQDLKSYVSSGSIKYIADLETKLEKLEEAGLENDSVKIERLLELAQDISESYGSKETAESLSIRYQVEKDMNNNSPLKLLVRIQDILSYLRKQDIEAPVKLPSITRQSLKNGSVPSNNFKVVRRFWKETSQRINDEAYNEGLDINKIVFEYYKAAGYTDLQGRLIGNQTHYFRNLFEDNDEMRFKNPYDNKNDLKEYERTFLKKALFIFAKYRYQNNGRVFSFTDPNSEEYKEFVQKNSIWYFNCPLKKASNRAFDRTSYNFDRVKRTVEKIMDDPKLWAKEFFTDKDLLKYVEDNKMPEDVTKLSVTNYFIFGETSLNGNGFNSGRRDEQLTLHENKEYFEHNVENLLRDFSFESIRAQNMTKMMLSSKLFLLQMHLSGRENNNIEDFKDEFDFINKYLKLNVFDLSIMDDTQRKMAKVILPVRNFVRYTLVAGNVASALRDTIEGVGQIMARAFVKNEIDISPTNVLKAYDIVVKQSIQDSLRGRELASIVTQLCIKYRISNIDVSNVAEGMKTGNKGINNFIDSLYWSVRKPDFLNRMTLFVTKCLEDGIWDAFYLDDKGNLAYDWKKDKRFTKFATGDKSDLDEYNKQKSLFFSLVHIWNKEHPTQQVKNFDTLPMPYSELDISSIKHTSDNIWGAYDKSEKALMEYGLLGQTFGMFTTWMNGQIETYFKPLQTQEDRFKYDQATDLDGNLLFLKDDGTITTDDTGVPLLAQVPIQVQGIFQTLRQTLRILTKLEDGTWDDEIWGNEVNKANIEKLCTDIVMTCIVAALIKLAVDGLRDKQKEVTDPNDFVTNAVCEVLSKGMYSAWDGFRGPLNAINYLGNNTNPPIYTESIAIARDLIKVISGDYTLLSFGSRHFALIRPIRESIKAAETGKQPKTYHR